MNKLYASKVAKSLPKSLEGKKKKILNLMFIVSPMVAVIIHCASINVSISFEKKKDVRQFLREGGGGDIVF